MSSTVTYKGSTLTTVENQTRILNTRGTWLEDNITITDVTQNSGGTPAISVVDTTDTNGGTIRTITALDISDTTAVASDVAQGKYFYTANGTKTAGTASGGDSSTTLITKEIITNGTYLASDDSADGYSSVTVNVPSSGITPTGSINITTNGTHDVTNYASAVVSVSGSGTPSATSHSIYFEFSDGTNTTLTYYDNEGTFINSAITVTTPTTYGGKTVTLAQLDGVTWYTRPTETWETLIDDNVQWIQDSENDYPYCWISSLSNVTIPNGSVWRITYDNVEYRLTAVSGKIGNPKWTKGTDDGTNVPFVFENPGWGAWTGSLNVPNVESAYYFKIERLVTS